MSSGKNLLAYPTKVVANRWRSRAAARHSADESAPFSVQPPDLQDTQRGKLARVPKRGKQVWIDLPSARSAEIDISAERERALVQNWGTSALSLAG